MSLIGLLLLVLILVAAGVRFRVTGMVAAKGRGLEDATVEYTANGEERTTTTDRKGNFKVKVPAGSEVIVTNVTKEGYVVTEAMPRTFVAEKTTAEINFVMEKA
jgi:hypothetical protein